MITDDGGSPELVGRDVPQGAGALSLPRLVPGHHRLGRRGPRETRSTTVSGSAGSDWTQGRTLHLYRRQRSEHRFGRRPRIRRDPLPQPRATWLCSRRTGHRRWLRRGSISVEADAWFVLGGSNGKFRNLSLIHI